MLSPEASQDLRTELFHREIKTVAPELGFGIVLTVFGFVNPLLLIPGVPLIVRGARHIQEGIQIRSDEGLEAYVESQQAHAKQGFLRRTAKTWVLQRPFTPWVELMNHGITV